MFIRQDRGLYVIDTEQDMLWEMRRRYRGLFKNNPVLNDMTQSRKQSSRHAGLLGEIIFERLYPTATKAENFSYDYLYDGIRIDVKCKLRNVPAHLGQDASIYEYQFKRCGADAFYFMSTMPDFNRVWLCGWVGVEEMACHRKARSWGKGDIDPKNGKRFSIGTLNLGYRELRKISLRNIEFNP